MNPRPPAFYDDAISNRLDQIAQAQGLSPNLGMFPMGAPIRRLVRKHNLAAVGGFHALMQQIAQPIVAQGVIDHSDFANNPDARMKLTGAFLYGVIFGTRDEAKLAVRNYARGHDRVFGYIAAGTCPDRAGERYTGWDDEARAWVLATILEAMIIANDLLFADEPYTPAEREAVWDDCLRIAEILDIRPLLPDSYLALRLWMEARQNDMKTGDVASSPLRPNLHCHRTTTLLSHIIFEKVPQYFKISASVAWYTTPPPLRPLLPPVDPVQRQLDWAAFLLLMRASSAINPYNEEWDAYVARTGDPTP